MIIDAPDQPGRLVKRPAERLASGTSPTKATAGRSQADRDRPCASHDALEIQSLGRLEETHLGDGGYRGGLSRRTQTLQDDAPTRPLQLGDLHAEGRNEIGVGNHRVRRLGRLSTRNLSWRQQTE
jgi:hypothetical protein